MHLTVTDLYLPNLPTGKTKQRNQRRDLPSPENRSRVNRRKRSDLAEIFELIQNVGRFRGWCGSRCRRGRRCESWGNSRGRGGDSFDLDWNRFASQRDVIFLDGIEI